MKKYYTAWDLHEDTDQCQGCTEVYLASDVDARIAELEKVLRWALSDGATYSKGSFYDGGCGCCASEMKPPEGTAEMISALMDGSSHE
jgi:hypothetical protein